MKGHIYGSSITMMRLGGFKFGINTAAYQELTRSSAYKWGRQDVFSKLDNLQFLGPGQDTITLNGVIYPDFKGGTQQLEILRLLALAGLPYLMVSGTGKILGMWVIDQIEEGQGVFAAYGVPRKQEFTLNLSKFSD